MARKNWIPLVAGSILTSMGPYGLLGWILIGHLIVTDAGFGPIIMAGLGLVPIHLVGLLITMAVGIAIHGMDGVGILVPGRSGTSGGRHWLPSSDSVVGEILAGCRLPPMKRSAPGMAVAIMVATGMVESTLTLRT